MIVLPLGGIPPPAKPITQSHDKANLPPGEFHIKPLGGRNRGRDENGERRGQTGRMTLRFPWGLQSNIKTPIPTFHPIPPSDSQATPPTFAKPFAPRIPPTKRPRARQTGRISRSGQCPGLWAHACASSIRCLLLCCPCSRWFLALSGSVPVSSLVPVCLGLSDLNPQVAIEGSDRPTQARRRFRWPLRLPSRAALPAAEAPPRTGRRE